MSKGERVITSKLVGEREITSREIKSLKDQTYKRESIKGERETSRGREYSRIPDVPDA